MNILDTILRILTAMFGGAFDDNHETTTLTKRPKACIDALEAEGKSYDEIDPLF